MSHLWEKENEEEKKKEKGRKDNRITKGMEGRKEEGIKKDRRKDKKDFNKN